MIEWKGSKEEHQEVKLNQENQENLVSLENQENQERQDNRLYRKFCI